MKEISNSDKKFFPGPRTKEIISICKEFEGSGLRTFETDLPQMVLESAGGVWLRDPDGNEYLDLFAGYSVENVGHNHPKVIEAICSQASKLLHCPSAYPNRTRANLLQKIFEITPKGIDRLLWAITGAQANEVALNLSKSATGKKEIIAFYGGYFGRTNGIIGLNGKYKSRVQLHLDPIAHFVPYPYCYRCALGGCNNPEECKIIDYIDNMLASPASGIGSVAAIFIEPIQGSGGVIIPPDSFLKKLSEICRQYDILLVIDEIQTGFGRTGRMWAFEHFDITPDLMSIGKGIGGGVPVSAVLGRKGLMTIWEPDIHTSTFLTNPLLHSAAIAAIEVMQEEKLWLNSAELGKLTLDTLSSALADHHLVGEIRGKGLFVGIEMVSDKKKKIPANREAKRVQVLARESGLFVGLAGYHGNVVRIGPPLIITRTQLELALDKLIQVFNSL